MKIQLTSNILIEGKNASPNDKNNGVYEVERTIANNLIARKRAVLFGEKVETPTPSANNNKPEFDIDALKNIANELNIKYNPNIGGQKLNEKILTELAGRIELELLEVDITNLDALKAYEAYKAAEKDNAKDEDVVDEITEEELREIAQAAEIELPEEATLEELKAVVKEALEDYASECELEAVENETIKGTWERIKAKLQNNDD